MNKLLPPCILLAAMALPMQLAVAHEQHQPERAHGHHHDKKHDHTEHKHAHADNHAQEHAHDHDHSHDHHHDDEFTQLGTHVHGEAMLTVVLEGNELQLALQSAAYNIVGFEHAPQNSEQQQEIAVALELLAQGAWFELSREAVCEVQSSDATTDLTNAGFSGHGDFYANFQLLCQRPARLNQLQLSLFNWVPSLQKIQVQWVINDRQGAATATLATHQVNF
ncbi:ZrgA family zinc uptake protein [Arsukibacterium sp.]|uniref:ZrgA family zinc uptake protein n=1 Tax=Arsukibacterium sp. TaxID=1977258 RepID=UPI002FD8CB2F